MRDGQRPAREGQRHDRVAVPLVVPAKIRVPSPDALPRERLEVRLADAWRHRLTLVVAPGGLGQDDARRPLRRPGGRPGGLVPGRDLGRGRGLVRAPPRGGAPVRAAGPARRLVEHRGRREGARDPARARGGARHRRRPRAGGHAPPRRRSGGSWTTRRRGSRSSSPAASRRRSTCPACASRTSCSSSGRTTCGSGPGRSSSCSATSTTTRCLPGDLAVLARRTEGWAAGLQLFHLATRGRSADERRRVLSGAETSGRLLREYLTQNVLFGLAEDLRRFLWTRACSGRLSGPLCDRLRETTGSGALLDELVAPERVHGAGRGRRRRVPLPRGPAPAPRPDAGRGGRRGRGARQARARGRRARGRRGAARGAARLLPRRGLGRRPAPAGRAGRAARGDRAERRGWTRCRPPSSATTRGSPWPPPAGRATTAAGRPRSTATSAPSPRSVRRGPPTRRGASASGIAAWLDPVAMPTPDAIGALRSGLVREPVLGRPRRGAARRPAGAGRARPAPPRGGRGRRRRSACSRRPPTPARRARSPVRRRGSVRRSRPVSAGSAWDARAMDRAIEEAERAGSPWLARLGRALARPAGDRARRSRASSTRRRWTSDGGQDPWGRALLDLAEAWASAGDPERRLAAADAATGQFRRLGRGRARGVGARPGARSAAASLGTPDAREAALAAESAGRARGIAGGADVRVRGAGRRRRGAGRGVRACSPRPSAADTGLVVPRTPGVAVAGDGGRRSARRRSA